MRRSLPLALLLATASTSALAEAPAKGADGAPVLTSLKIPSPPHCLAADQWKAPDMHPPAAIFDGDPGTSWWLCPEAADESGYAIEARFSRPVKVDLLRLVVDGTDEPSKRLGRPVQVDVLLFDHSLSTTQPVYSRALSIPADRPTADLALNGRLAFNPRLISDTEFGDKKRARGLKDVLPLPLMVDGVTLVFREVRKGELPVSLADVVLMFEHTPVVFDGLDEVHRRERALVERGIVHIVAGRYLVDDNRALYFEKEGTLFEMPLATWLAGAVDAKKIRKLGRWHIEDARLEVATGKKADKFEPVDYFLDEAPHKVLLRTAPVAGTFRVEVEPPAAAQPTAALPTLGADPSGEPPPLLLDP